MQRRRMAHVAIAPIHIGSLSEKPERHDLGTCIASACDVPQDLPETLGVLGNPLGPTGSGIYT